MRIYTCFTSCNHDSFNDTVYNVHIMYLKCTSVFLLQLSPDYMFMHVCVQVYLSFNFKHRVSPQTRLTFTLRYMYTCVCVCARARACVYVCGMCKLKTE